MAATVSERPAPAIAGRGPESAGALAQTSKLRLVALTITPRGSELVVGDARQGQFVVLPAIAGPLLEQIASGAPLAKVAADARELAGEDVDVLDFASALIDLGFVTHIDRKALPTNTSRLTDGGRLGSALAVLGRPLFSRTAWIVYAILALGCTALLVLEPRYRPDAHSLFFLRDPLASVALLSLINSVLVVLHETAHWLGARVQGIPARITLGRRLYILVAETDLTSLMALPRRQRFGALLAGLAFEVTSLTLLLGAQIAAAHGVWDAPPTLARLITALILLRLIGIAFQFFVFVRTDLYAVLVIGLDCVQLTRTTQLTIRRTIGRLNPTQAQELAHADARDLQIARYYRWLYLAGMIGAAWYLATYAIPWAATVIGWIITGLSNTPITALRFWECLAFTPLALGPLLLPIIMLGRQHIHRRGK